MKRAAPSAFALLTGRARTGRAFILITLHALWPCPRRGRPPSLPLHYSPCPFIPWTSWVVRGRFIHTPQGDSSCTQTFQRPPQPHPSFIAHAPGRQSLTVRLTAFTNIRAVAIVPRLRDQMTSRSAPSRFAGDRTSTTITRTVCARVAATNITASGLFPAPRRHRRRGALFFPLHSPPCRSLGWPSPQGEGPGRSRNDTRRLHDENR